MQSCRVDMMSTLVLDSQELSSRVTSSHLQDYLPVMWLVLSSEWLLLWCWSWHLWSSQQWLCEFMIILDQNYWNLFICKVEREYAECLIAKVGSWRINEDDKQQWQSLLVITLTLLWFSVVCIVRLAKVKYLSCTFSTLYVCISQTNALFGNTLW